MKPRLKKRTMTMGARTSTISRVAVLFVPALIILAALLILKAPPRMGIVVPKEPDYLIVVPDALADAANQLKTYREGTGRVVAITKLSQIGAGQLSGDSIDAWIENYQKLHKRLRYVALIGDASAIPHFEIPLRYYDQTVKSDLPYSVPRQSFPAEYRPQLIVGRIPVQTPEELETYLEKVKRFEAGLAGRKNVVFFGYSSELDYYATGRDADLARTLGYQPTVIFNPTEEVLLASLNSLSPKIAAYYGHGNWYANWPLTMDNLAGWQNSAAPAIYLSGGCGFGDSTAMHGSLSGSLLLGDNGSVSSIGASDNGGYGYDYVFISSFLKASTTASTIGDAFLEAMLKEDAAGRAAEGDNTDWLYDFAVRMGMLGDPALKIR